MRKFWTEEERNLLREYYPSHTNQETADFLGRGLLSMMNEARRLGLKVNKKIWTEAQELFLKENYNNHTYSELIEKLGKTEIQIFKKLKDFGVIKASRPKSSKKVKAEKIKKDTNTYIKSGLHKNQKFFTISEITQIKEDFDNFGIEYCVSKFNKTKRQIFGILKDSKKDIPARKIDPKILYEMYVVQSITHAKIAEEFGCTMPQVRLALRQHEIFREFQVSSKGDKSKNWKGSGDVSGKTFSHIKKRSIKSKLDFDLTIEYLSELFILQNKKCKISGVDIDFKNSDSKASLDRVDSSKGYVEGNVQWVHKIVNFMKQALPDNEFINWCRIIADNNMKDI